MILLAAGVVIGIVATIVAEAVWFYCIAGVMMDRIDKEAGW